MDLSIFQSGIIHSLFLGRISKQVLTELVRIADSAVHDQTDVPADLGLPADLGMGGGSIFCQQAEDQMDLF
jgi:hypothetical protein